MPHLVAAVTLFLTNSGLVPESAWGEWIANPPHEEPAQRLFQLDK